MHVELLVLSLLLLGFSLWLRHGSNLVVAAQRPAKSAGAVRPTKNIKDRPKHHNTPEYVRVSRQVRNEVSRQNLERWQQRARSECLK